MMRFLPGLSLFNGLIPKTSNSSKRARLDSTSSARQGFTLIEILVVIGIMGLLVAITFASYRIFSRQVDLETTAQKILSTLQLARNQTQASEDETQYGVHFEVSKYVLFKGATYNAADPNNKDYDLTSAEIYEINLGGGSEVVFDRIRGTSANSGNVKVRVLADTSKTRTIVINPAGQVSLEETVNPTDTRIADTRHLHFSLGWSIQSSVTLTLVFSDPPNPDVVQNIAMASYFNATKTEFDWEGTTDVGGSDQTIRVNTHLLNATDTNLSVHRDRQKNSKAVQILIDGKDIVSYTAAGVATLGSFGGSMSVQ